MIRVMLINTSISEDMSNAGRSIVLLLPLILLLATVVYTSVIYTESFSLGVGPYYYYYVGPTTAPPAAPTTVSPAPPPITVPPIAISNVSATFNLTQYISGGTTTSALALKFECARLEIKKGTLIETDGEPATSLAIVMRLGEDPGVPNVTLASPVCTIFSPGVERVEFTGPAILYMRYDEVPPGFSPADLVIAFFNRSLGTWVPLPTVVETASKRAWAKVDHFTDFAVVVFEVVPVDPHVELRAPSRLYAGTESTVVAVVRSPEGAPLGGVAVRLYVNGEYWETSATDVAGRAIFKVAFDQPGTYRLYAETHGYRSKVAVVNVVKPPTLSSLRLEAMSNVVRVGQPVTLLIGAYTADGAPLGGVTLRVMVNGRAMGTVTTGENGLATFTFTPSSPGTYVVRASSGQVWAETVIEVKGAKPTVGEQPTASPTPTATPAPTTSPVEGGATTSQQIAETSTPESSEGGAPTVEVERTPAEEVPTAAGGVSPLAVGIVVVLVLIAAVIGLAMARRRGLLNLRLPLRRPSQ